jgi:beta-1,4-mannosyl-glycoprotein beta-1,4-N-acetylglucosaminyltransferase
MVYDGFMFFNELELLDIRLHELDSVVDKFVLVEAKKTHSRKDKSLYFEDNKSSFKEYLDKIIHVVLDDFPEGDSWSIENFQRNSIMLGLKNCNDEDIIMISDADEIPRNTIFKDYNNFKDIGGNFYTTVQTMFYYYLNTYFSNYLWPGTLILKYKTLKEQSPQYFKNKIKRGIKIQNGGWHFSYLGGVKNIQLKLDSFAHTEFSSGIFIEKTHIEKCITELQTIHTRKPHNIPMIIGDINQKGFLPEYVVENTGKFKEFIK